MSCFLTTGTPCALLQSPRPDLFEVHVTIGPSGADELRRFLALCAGEGWKGIVIDLDPASPQQPMTCSRVTGAPHEAFAHAEQVRRALELAGFIVTRVKIEAAPWNSAVPHLDRQHPDQRAYFEHHIKLALPPDGWEAELAALCAAFGAHLSRNALLRRENGEQERFATLRSHQQGLHSFQQHTERFAAALRSHGFAIVSAVSEYCIYDSNLALDDGWEGRGPSTNGGADANTRTSEYPE